MVRLNETALKHLPCCVACLCGMKKKIKRLSNLNKLWRLFILWELYWPWDTIPQVEVSTVDVCVCVCIWPKDWHGDTEINRGRGEGSHHIHLHSPVHSRTTKAPQIENITALKYPNCNLGNTQKIRKRFLQWVTTSFTVSLSFGSYFHPLPLPSSLKPFHTFLYQLFIS